MKTKRTGCDPSGAFFRNAAFSFRKVFGSSLSRFITITQKGKQQIVWIAEK